MAILMWSYKLQNQKLCFKKGKKLEALINQGLQSFIFSTIIWGDSERRPHARSAHTLIHTSTWNISQLRVFQIGAISPNPTEPFTERGLKGFSCIAPAGLQLHILAL